MINTIVFDWGGVLIEQPTVKVIDYCAKYFNIKIKDFSEALIIYKNDFQKGILSERNLWKKICTSLNISLPKVNSLWRIAFEEVYEEKKEMFTLVSSLKKRGYKIGFLSNTELPAMNFFIEQNYDMIDICVFSCKEGIIKPDIEIYKILLNQINSDPKDVIFIDDRPENIDAANKIGVNGILFIDEHHLKADLSFFKIKF
jgi:putative hydrolase of the HAD superfamily